MILYLVSVGFVSILAQVVLLRELSVAFFGVELIYILAIAIWLLWTAVGTMIGRRVPGASAAGMTRLFALFAFLLPLDVSFVRALRVISGGVPGAYLSMGVQLLDLVAALFPVGVVLGVLFQWAAASYVGGGRTLARAYALESAGGLLGGLAATILLALGVQNFLIGVACSGAAALTALAAGRRPPSPRGRNVLAVAAAAFAALLALASPRLDRSLTRINHDSLVASRDSPYGRVTVTRREDQFVVFENDVLAFETQSVAAEEFVHLAATSAGTLRRVLILGGGVDGTAVEASKYSPERIDLVEVNATLVQIVEEHLPSAWRESPGSSAANLAIADPRRFVTAAGGTYDLLLIGAPDPTSGETNRFYTREFFRQCRKLLSPGGVLALRVRSSENVWTPFLTLRNASIYRALEDAFDDVVVLPGVTNIVLASNARLERDPAVLGERLAFRNVTTRLVTAEYIRYLYTNDRFDAIARALGATDIPSNSDTRPVCYRYSAMIWLSKFFPSLITAGGGSRGPSFPPVPVAITAVLAGAGILLGCRRRISCRRIALAALAGLTGMLLEAVLILHFQVTNGVLYRDLGVLLMAFMAGLATGAGLIPGVARRKGDNTLVLNRMWGAGFAVCTALLCLAFAAMLHFAAPAGLPRVSLMLFLAGSLTASQFAYASLIGGGGEGGAGTEDQRKLVTPLYAADILGGCVASVLGSIFLIPLLGMETTAVVTAVVALLALLGV